MRPLLHATLVLVALSAPAHAHPGCGLILARDGSMYFVVYGANDIHVRRPGGQVVPFTRGLRNPHHLVARGDTLYTASDDAGRVVRIAPDGAPSRHPIPPWWIVWARVGLTGDPFTVDSAGLVYAPASTDGNTLVRMTQRGRTRIAAGASFRPLHASCMAWGPRGALYVTDAHRVWRIRDRPAAPPEARAILPRGDTLIRAYGVAAAPDGQVIVTDINAGRVLRLSPDGAVTTPAAWRALRFERPSGVAIAANGDVVLVENPRLGVALWQLTSAGATQLYRGECIVEADVCRALAEVTGAGAPDAEKKRPRP